MNAFTSPPTIKLRASKHKRPDLAPRQSGITLGDHRDPVERQAKSVLRGVREEFINRLQKRGKR